MSEQNETTNKETDILKRNQILKLNSTVTGMKSSPEQFDSRLEQAERSISKPEVTTTEII